MHHSKDNDLGSGLDDGATAIDPGRTEESNSKVDLLSTLESLRAIRMELDEDITSLEKVLSMIGGGY